MACVVLLLIAQSHAVCILVVTPLTLSLGSLSCMHAMLMCIVDLSNLQLYYLQSWTYNGLFSAPAPRVLHYSASFHLFP